MEACEKAGVRDQLHVAKGAEHGFDTDEIALQACEFVESVLKF
jgi:hypothetical protein